MNEEKQRKMEEGGQLLALILEDLKVKTVPGIKTGKLNEIARRLCLKYQVRPSFLGYEGFPAAVCVSINEEVVHGIPGERIIKKGDLVSLDFGIFFHGYHTDAAISFGVGELDDLTKKLLSVTEKALYFGIEEARPGKRIGDIGAEIQEYVEENGFSVIRTLVGHGVGRNLHEEPLIPNYGQRGTGSIIKEGMALAIEPMVAAGSQEVSLASDNWTYRTNDQSKVAHFEHTVYVSPNGPIVLTSRI